MVYGDVRDVRSNLLPDSATPRFFLEKLGRFMGVELGPEWTLGREIDRVAARAGRGVVIESVVYEASVIRERGGMIYRVERDCDGPAGLYSDDAQAAIEVDGVIDNNGTLEELAVAVRALMR